MVAAPNLWPDHQDSGQAPPLRYPTCSHIADAPVALATASSGPASMATLVRSKSLVDAGAAAVVVVSARAARTRIRLNMWVIPPGILMLACETRTPGIWITWSSRPGPPSEPVLRCVHSSGRCVDDLVGGSGPGEGLGAFVPELDPLLERGGELVQ